VHSAEPRTSPGYSPRDAAACHTRLADKPTGPRPGGLVQLRKRPAVHASGTLAARSPRTVHARGGALAHSPVSQWRLSDGKVLPVSTGGAPGRRRAWSRGIELTGTRSSTGRWLGGGEAAALQRRGSSGGW
jgi:hypothetical protein